MVKRVIVALAACFALTLAVPNTALAQPDSGGNTYGFDATCDQLHDMLSKIPLGIGSALGDSASALCKGGNAASHPQDVPGAIADKAWDSAFGKVVDSLLEGLGQALTLSLVWWTKLPNEQLADSGLFTKVSDYTYEIQLILLIASTIVTGIRLAEARRGATLDQAAEGFRLYARVVLSSWMFGAIIVVGTRGGDRLSTWLIDDATGGNAKGIAELMVKTNELQAFSPGLILVVAVVGLLGALAQCVLAVIRQGLLIVAVGFVPVAAAASGLKIGMQSYQKLIGWVIAFLLWKPVAAVVYMIAFTTAGSIGAESASDTPNSEQAQRILVGVVLLCSVSFVLPALMRLVVPAVSTIGAGGSGLGAAGVAALAVAAAATGGKALGAKGAAAPGAAGFVSGGGGPRPSGSAGGGRVPPPNSPPPRPAQGGGTATGGAVPAGAGGRTSSRRSSTAVATTGTLARSADRAAGRLTGDSPSQARPSGVIRR
ncbi:hypothetical protein [Nocardia arthritidis]|uniref:Conjugal transfer protein TrbL n=1 Tax=Nocardia arthritidis TaxID=228602 RepID=A0A6G9YL53_9NOCA|nr:hypothetical protein [Nocardia arthritidis]QIS13942.1 hypothetical protein F5544_30495 [Nocardia arthritidis]